MRHLTSQLLIPIALVVVVGIAQIMFAVDVLTEGRSASWFMTITVVGTVLNMGIIVYTTGSTTRRARSGSAAIETVQVPKHFWGRLLYLVVLPLLVTVAVICLTMGRWLFL